MAFELMQEMHWTWADYESTPIHVRQFCLDFIMRRRRAQKNQHESASDSGGGAVIRVKR